METTIVYWVYIGIIEKSGNYYSILGLSSSVFLWGGLGHTKVYQALFVRNGA